MKACEIIIIYYWDYRNAIVTYRIYIALMAIFIFSLIMVTENYADEQNIPVTISADHLEYIKEKNIIFGQGNIEIKHIDTTITGEKIIANLDTNELQIEGKVTIIDRTGELKGDNVVYNLKTKKGLLQDGVSFRNPWYIIGKQVQKVSDEKVIITQGYFTTCNLSNPHYCFKAKKIEIYINDKIVAKNVFLYVGEVPIFYFPIFRQSLKGRKYDLDVRVGYNNSEGDFTKIIFGYPLTAYLYSRLYLDYMSKKGWGKGGEFVYNYDNMRGSIYGYHIRETDVEKERWNGEIAHWQRFKNNLTLVSNLNFLSDENFNKQYKEQDVTKINRDLKSYIALTLNQRLYVARLVGERKDIWQGEKFIRDYVYFPRLSLTVQPVKIYKNKKLPLYYRNSFNFDNYYAQFPNDFYQITANVDQTLNSGIRLNSFINIIPSIGFQEQWQNKTSKTDTKGLNRHIYRASIDFRNTINKFFYITYAYKFQEEIGKAPDNNELLGRLNFIFPMRIKEIDSQGKTIIKIKNLGKLNISTTYDLREKDLTFTHWKQRFSSLIADLVFNPVNWYSLTLNSSYNLYTERTEKLQTNVKFLKPKWEISLASTYLDSQPSVIDTSSSVSFWLTKKWKINFTNRASVYYKPVDFKYSVWSERTYTIYRDLHCWEAQFYWTKKPYEEQLWFKINIKVFPNQKIGLQHNVEEEEWYLTHGK